MSEQLTPDARYARQMALFGAGGQARLVASRVAIIGLGGLGAHVAQQLAYLGVGNFSLRDADRVSTSNLNRLVGASQASVGLPKVEVARNLIHQLQPTAVVSALTERLQGDQASEMLEGVDVVFGCVDSDVARLDIVRAASSRALPYIDLASDVAPGDYFGGRIVFAKDGERCLSCLGELDQHELARAQMTDEQRRADDKIYGIDRTALAEAGPSVVSVNGVVASLAVTEFMVWVTGLRSPRGYLTYRGDIGTVTARVDPDRAYCHYCMTLWGTALRGRNASSS